MRVQQNRSRPAVVVEKSRISDFIELSQCQFRPTFHLGVILDLYSRRHFCQIHLDRNKNRYTNIRVRIKWGHIRSYQVSCLWQGSKGVKPCGISQVTSDGWNGWVGFGGEILDSDRWTNENTYIFDIVDQILNNGFCFLSFFLIPYFWLHFQNLFSKSFMGFQYFSSGDFLDDFNKSSVFKEASKIFRLRNL